jgi:hypothetical protein
MEMGLDESMALARISRATAKRNQEGEQGLQGREQAGTTQTQVPVGPLAREG